MSEADFEPMSVGGILDRAFRLYRQSFVRFLAIVAIIQVPLHLLTMVWAVVVERTRLELAQSGPDVQRDEVFALMGIGVLGSLVSGVVTLVAQQLTSAALVKGISERYLGREVTVGEAYRFIWPKALSLIGAALLVGLIVGLGYLLCIVPGVIFALWYALTAPAIVIESRRATQGMARSKDLASGNLGRIFLVFLVVFLITIAFAFMFQAAATLLSQAVFAESTVAATVAQHLFQMIPAILVMPISAAASVLLYYDLRIRKEGFDLEMLAERLAPDRTPDTERADG